MTISELYEIIYEKWRNGEVTDDRWSAFCKEIYPYLMEEYRQDRNNLFHKIMA